MKKKNQKTRVAVVTNCILAVLIVGVFSVGFLPERIAPIFQKNDPSVCYEGSRESGRASLLFYVTGDASNVSEILDILQKTDVKCTFFVSGSFALTHETLVFRVAQEGHELGNHGCLLTDHGKMTYEENLRDIRACGEILEKIGGTKPRLFAPPDGSFKKTTVQAAKDAGCATVLWSKSQDKKDTDVKKIVQRAADGVKSGDLILLYPKKETVAALPEILGICSNSGIKLTTVSETIQG